MACALGRDETVKPTVILVNPWIYDFAAYDFWSKPLGLLSIAGRLRQAGLHVHLIDCLDVSQSLLNKDDGAKRPVRRAFGTGKFQRTRVSSPPPLQGVRRPYSRYGCSPEAYQEALRRVPGPLAILVTSLMTYWYPGVQEAIRLARRIHPGVPVILGGIYARLCEDHALRLSGADRVIKAGGLEAVLDALEQDGLLWASRVRDAGRTSYPAFDLLHGLDYVCLLTSEGCPYRCAYCASSFLRPGFSQKDPHEVLGEILHWVHEYGVRDFVFYDDALLISPESHLIPLLERVVSADIRARFHTPNAVHAREVTQEVARLMLRAGFETIRLGLETLDASREKGLDFKVSEGEFGRAVRHLLNCGFSSSQVGAYVLMGLPGQTAASVAEAIRFVADAGALPYLSEYSPIPHTRLWEEALQSSEYDLQGDPLFHNNTLVPCWDEERRREIPRLKDLALQCRRSAGL